MKNTKSLKHVLIILFILVALIGGVIFNNRLMATALNERSQETTESSVQETNSDTENVEILEPLSAEDSYTENKIDNVVLEEMETLQAASIAPLSATQEVVRGRSTVSIDTVKKYLKSIIGASNYNSYHDEVIQNYYNIAPLYGIRPEVAISQSMLETNYFRYTGIVKSDQYNFAGIYATGTPITATQAGSVDYIYGADPSKVKLVAGENGARFSSVASGVEGHIQHLYAYATTNPIPSGRTLIDPRYNLVKTTPNFGKTTYIDNLIGWATDVNYGTKIVTILKSVIASQTDPIPSNLTPVTDIADGYYSISSVANGLALESYDSGYDNGLLVKQNTLSSKSSQTTYFEKQSDNSYIITFYHSKKALDVSGSKTLTQWTTHKLNNQHWMLYKDSQNNIYIKSLLDNSFIEVKSNVANDDLILNTVIGASDLNKQFTLNKITTLPTAPYVAEVTSGLYKIQSVFSNKNLEIYAGSFDNGATLSQWINNGYNNQVFEVQNTSEGTYIIGNDSKKALDVNSYIQGTQILQKDKINIASQKFKITKSSKTVGAFNIVSSGQTVFDVQSTVNGAQIVLKNISGATSQDFKFNLSLTEPRYPVSEEEITQVTDLADGYYTINSAVNGLALESQGYDNGNYVKQNTAGNLTNQTSYFEKQSDGTYVITFYHSKKSLDLNNSKALTQWKTHKLDNQRWILYRDKSGNLLIKSKVDNSYVELKSSIPNDDISMNSNLSSTNPNKKFILNKVTTLSNAPYVAEIANGLYKIQSDLSGRNLEIYAGSLDNGGELDQWSNNKYNNQVFEVENTVDGSYIIGNDSRKALDSLNHPVGSTVVQQDKSLSLTQKFKIVKSQNKVDSYNIVSNNGSVFNVQDVNNGARVVLSNMNKTANQDFQFTTTNAEATYPIKEEEISQITNLENGYYTINSVANNLA
ncbi:MAG: RICIN domain-containing protein, partial [Alphaproteobacteria bacterium]